MADQLTREDIAKVVADAMKEHKDTQIERKFTPGMGVDGRVEVTKDAADQPWDNLGEQLQAIVKAGSPGSPIREPRLSRSVEGALHPVTKAPTGMGETVPHDGAFLVAQEFIPTLINRMYNTGIVFSRCAKQTVGPNFNGFKIPAIDETSRADGSRWGGVRAYWAAEAGTKTASQPKFRQISIELQKLIALCYITDELLADATALSGYVNQWFPAEMGFKLDDAVINGDGAGKPLGILNGPGLVTVAKETGQAATTVVTNNILKMWRRCWAPSWANAVWFVNQNTLEQLATMVIPIGTAGALAHLFVMPTTNGATYGSMLGRPVIPIEQAASIGTVGDIILADLTQYIVGEKGGMNSASSIHVAFTTDQTAFRWVYRVNGEPIWHSALTPYKGTSDTLSPYVALATRGA